MPEVSPSTFRDEASISSMKEVVLACCYMCKYQIFVTGHGYAKAIAQVGAGGYEPYQ